MSVFVILSAVLTEGSGAVQQEEHHAGNSAAKRAVALRAETTPVIDGKLDEPVWETPVPVSDFVQHEPNEGAPATERTEVRILYDSKNLYFGVRCYDEEASRILVSESRRDSELTETDAFWMVLDTYHDRQNGFVFGTNPMGIEFDGQVTGDGVGGGSARNTTPGQPIAERGSGAGFNKYWDGNWSVRTTRDEKGWTAEFAIPLTTLRFEDSESQVWGANFARNIRRKNEQVYWSPVPRQWNLYRVSLAGELTALALKQPRNLKVIPYLLGSVQRDFTQDPDFRSVGFWGADLKYSLTPNLTLDTTYQTDFAQVEVDEEQVNLTRFNLFFPEKRPFFLENAGFFAVGTSRSVELFFSRRIGLGPRGAVIPIQGGARLSGKVGRWNLGFLEMQTEALEDCGGSPRGSCVAPGTNFFVGRVSHQLGRRSGFGGIVVDKQALGSGGEGKDYNRAVALDGRLGLGDSFLVSGFVAKTATFHAAEPKETFQGDDYAYNASLSYQKRRFRASWAYTDVARNFNPEVGFLEQRDFRRLNGGVNTFFRVPSIKWLREFSPHSSWRRWEARDGFLLSETLHLDCWVDWNNGTHFSPAVDILYEGLREPFEVFPGVVIPPGEYRHAVLAWRFNSNLSAPFSVQAAVDAGGFYNGSLRSYRLALNWRYGAQLTTSVSYTQNNGRFPRSADGEYGGSFRGDLVQIRLNYSFTPRLFVQSLMQYNDAGDNWSVNLRFGWLNTAGTGLFVVYNETQDLEGIPFSARSNVLPGGPLSRALFIKFTREFRIFE